jgi:hypothetical protein
MLDLGAEPEIELELFLLPTGVLPLFRFSWRRLAGAEVNEIWAAMAPCAIRGELGGG